MALNNSIDIDAPFEAPAQVQGLNLYKQLDYDDVMDELRKEVTVTTVIHWYGCTLSAVTGAAVDVDGNVETETAGLSEKKECRHWRDQKQIASYTFELTITNVFRYLNGVQLEHGV